MLDWLVTFFSSLKLVDWLGIWLILIISAFFIYLTVTSVLNWYYDNQLGKNNATEWAVAFEVYEYGSHYKTKHLYHTQNVVANVTNYYAQLLPRDATVFTNMFDARTVCEAYVTDRDNCRSMLLGKQYFNMVIKLMEKRSYLGFKAWHCVHKGIPDQ